VVVIRCGRVQEREGLPTEYDAGEAQPQDRVLRHEPGATREPGTPDRRFKTGGHAACPGLERARPILNHSLKRGVH